MKTSNALPGAGKFAAALFAAALLNSQAAGQNEKPKPAAPSSQKPDWMEGSGKDLRIRLAGEVRDETGAPVDDFRIRMTLMSGFSRTRVLPRIENNRFRASIPVGERETPYLHVHAVSRDGRRVARADVSPFDLRQLAIDGLTLTLRPPERIMQVRVVEGARPAAGAHVTVDVGGATFDAETDDDGLAQIPLLKRDRPLQLTAWTDDFRIGGFAFYRDPPRDPSGNEFTIELDQCRPQTIRLVNEETSAPVPDLEFLLFVGTGEPNYQFPGRTPACEMRTNDRGEAVYRWFPDWKKEESYIELLDPRWVRVEREESVNGSFVVRVKENKRLGTRKRVVGQVLSPERSVAGVGVKMWSFQGEQKNRIDSIHAFTDENGRFAGDYLPGSTYCIHVDDARLVSDIIDLIPYDPETDEIQEPSLTLREGRPVEVIATAGPTRTPLPFRTINLETPHRITWLEDGKNRTGLGHRRWFVTTDAEGKANTWALPGNKLRGSIHEFELKTEVIVDVPEEGVTRLEIHSDGIEDAE